MQKLHSLLKYQQKLQGTTFIVFAVNDLHTGQTYKWMYTVNITVSINKSGFAITAHGIRQEMHLPADCTTMKMHY